MTGIRLYELVLFHLFAIRIFFFANHILVSHLTKSFLFTFDIISVDLTFLLLSGERILITLLLTQKRIGEKIFMIL